METTRRPAHSAPRPRWLLVLGSFIAIVAFFMALGRRTRSQKVIQHTPVPSPVPTSLVIEPPARASDPRERPPARFGASGWMLLPVLFIAGASLIVLQNFAPAAAGWLFIGMLVSSLLLAIWSSTLTSRRSTQLFITELSARNTAAIRIQLRRFSAWVGARRGLFTMFTAMVALGLLVLSAMLFQDAPLRSKPLGYGFILAIAAGVWLGFPIFLSRRTLTLPRISPLKSLTEPRRLNLGLTGMGVLSLAALSEANAHILHIVVLGEATSEAQFVLLCAGIALVVLGLDGVRVLPRFSRVVVRYLRPANTKKREIALPAQRSALNAWHFALIAILLIAFGLRFWRLNDSARFFIDELNHVNAILDLLGEPQVGLLTPFSGITAFPYIFPYGQKIAVEIFGHNYVGVRAFSAVLGTLTVAAAYRLGHALFDRKTGLIAALLLATFPPHLQFSRIGLNNIGDPLFGTLALAFLAQGVRYNRRIFWVLGGAMLGLTHYFYEAGRLLFTPLVVLWLVGVWVIYQWQRRMEKPPSTDSSRKNTHIFFLNGLSERIRSFLRQQQNWRVTALALVIVAAPIYFTLLATDRPLTARLVDNQTGLGGEYWRALFEEGTLQEHVRAHIVPAFAAYVSEYDETLFYGGHTALVLVFVLPFFLLGLAFLLWHWRSPCATLLLVWILCASLGNSLMVQSAAYTRFVLVFPALMLVAAVGIRYGLRLILGSGEQWWKTALIVGLTVVLAALQIQYYFDMHIPVFNAEMRVSWQHPDAEDAILRSLDFPAGTQLHLISLIPADGNYDKGILYFMRPDLTLDALTPSQLTPDYFSQLTCGVDHAFFIAANDWDSFSRMRQEFYLRQAKLSPYGDIPPNLQYVLYYAPYWPGNERPFRNRCSPPA